MSPFGLSNIWAHDEKAKRGLISCFLDGTISAWDFKSNIGLERLLAAYPYEQGPENISKAIVEIMKLTWPAGAMGLPFKTFQGFERFLVASGFRGHFIHQFEVYLVGLNVLMAIWKRTPAKSRASVFGTQEPNLLREGWILSAMGHDLGYPIEGKERITDALSNLYKEMDVQEAAQEFRRGGKQNYTEREQSLRHVRLDQEEGDIISRFLLLEDLVVASVFETLGTQGNSMAREIVRKSIEKNSHGVASALMLARAFSTYHFTKGTGALESEPKAFFDTPGGTLFKKTLAAVALHDFRGENNPLGSITFQDNPFAIILYVTDNIQDWERNYIPEGRPWDYRLTKFVNKISEILLQCDLQPTRRIDNIQQAFHEEVQKKRAVQSILKKPPDGEVKVRLSIEFTLQGSERTTERVEFVF